MWRLKQLIPKEQAGLEGRVVDVGNVKVHVRNAIAEGGFSCVYLARDALNPTKQYALKHMICNDDESLDLVMKEISVMNLLKGHPNVVTLVAHAILDMGRTKEALLVMEFCEKSLVGVLESRGVGYFDEKQILLIFRDVCNAVFAMHNHSPPIAHRDLKVENVLLGSDGAWKLCDFGSTSTNHKRFDRPEEMGIEEDNIRKHTTPAYRAPEMWDLFRREVISEKVDIWALGCLLYRICYFKSAFDGESKLQILNGNYRIPELPKYSTSITGLIKDMLEGSPDSRPDITQVWFRVNEQLPMELQKHLPDGSSSVIGMCPPTSDLKNEGVSRRIPLMPSRNPPPPPSREQVPNVSPQLEKEMQHSRTSQGTPKTAGGGGGTMGSFWSTQHAQDTHIEEDKGPLFDEAPADVAFKQNQNSLDGRFSPKREQHVQPGQFLRGVQGNPHICFGSDKPSQDFEIRFSPENRGHGSGKSKGSQTESKTTFANEAFNSFVAEFDANKLSSGSTLTARQSNASGKEELEAEVELLKVQLKQATLEKDEIASKFDKLSAICRSQRQEIQELKRALAAASSSPISKESTRTHPSPAGMQTDTPPREKIEGTVWELQQGLLASNSPSHSPDPKPWQAFADEPKSQPLTPNNSRHPKSVRITNGFQNNIKPSVLGPAKEGWGFDQDNFRAAPTNSQISRASAHGNNSQRFGSGDAEKAETSQPAGWAGF